MTHLYLSNGLPGPKLCGHRVAAVCDSRSEADRIAAQWSRERAAANCPSVVTTPTKHELNAGVDVGESAIVTLWTVARIWPETGVAS